MGITEERADEIANRMRYSLKIQNAISFADMNIAPPDIDFYPDDVQFYDPAANQIHIGSHGIVKMFNPETEASFLMSLNFLRGHEEQHCRSTARVPYAWGIQRSVETILEYIALKECKTRKRFKGARDYANFADVELPKMGIYISFSMMTNIMAGIANSIEDGRIERIRANRLPGFAAQRKYHRAYTWQTCTEKFEAWKDIRNNPSEQLRIIVNQILSLATTGLYQKGFTMAYASTPLMDTVNTLMPHIAKGVMSGRCRQMAAEVIEVAKVIAPLVYDTCKMSQADIDAKKALEKMLADLIASMIDNMPETNLSENDEDTDDGIPSAALPISDLVITLEDDVYDKLMEKAKESDSGAGITIKRKHPKEEDNDGESEDKGGASSGDKEKSGNPSQDGKTESSDGEANESSEDDTPSSSAGKNAASKESDIKGSAGSEGQSDDAKEAESKANDSISETQPTKSHKGWVNGSNHTPENVDEAHRDEVITQAMQDAAAFSEEEAKAKLDNAREASGYERRTEGKPVEDTSKELTEEDVKDVIPDRINFKEYKRLYDVKSPLPPVVTARGRVLRRNNERYFRSLSTPNRRYLESGSIDPSRIYGLSFGDTNIFKKTGIDKKFDGCVYVLIDNSGSMSGVKREEACKASAVIEEGFKGILPMKIVAFDYSGGVIHEVVKGWEESQTKNCSWNFCLHGRWGQGNADAYDIQIAEAELQRRPERKKLLVVLSDGMPAEASAAATKSAIQKARSRGVKVCGIYFEEGEVSDYYSRQFKDMYGNKDAICCPVKEIDKNLSAVLKRFSRS